MTPLSKLVYEAIHYANQIDNELIPERSPNEFFHDYGFEFQDWDYDSLATRIAAEVERLQAVALSVEYFETDRSY